MSVSTIPAAKQALLDALQARPALSEALVRWGAPGRVTRDRVRVIVDVAVDINREWAGLGARRMSETYTINVIVEAYTTGDDTPGAEQALWDAVAEVDDVVRGDITLDGVVWKSEPGQLSDQETGTADQEGLLSRVVVGVSCEARI